MTMCIQNSASICLYVLKIWRKKPNSDVNQGMKLGCKFAKKKKKKKINNSKVDLVNDNVYTTFGLNRLIRFQGIEPKLNSDFNQGP